jgi:opacity protein-like surface antigen
MFKKLLIASAVLAASTSVAFAGCYKGEPYKGEVAPCPCYNPIVAPYLGLSVGNQINYGRTNRAFDGIPVTGSFGYGGIIAPYWYLAGEVFGDYDIQVKNFAIAGSGYKNTWSYGASIIPGYMINSMVLGYVRLGVVREYFSGPAQWGTGGQAGVGLQTGLCQNWELRAEYVYSYIGKTDSIGKPQQAGANVGLIYRFA